MEHGQGVVVEDFSTWTQEDYLDYYGSEDEETVNLFPFETGDVEDDVIAPQEIKPTIAANQMKSQELNQDADEIKKKTTNDDLFLKSPDELVLIG